MSTGFSFGGVSLIILVFCIFCFTLSHYTLRLFHASIAGFVGFVF
jgi:hypothetical protein